MYPLFSQVRGRWWRTLFTLCCGDCAATPAYGDITTTALARASSNYLYRGYTKSDDHAVIQAHAGLRHSSGLYTGAWLSQLDFGGAQLEFIPYVGMQRKLGGDVRFDGVVSGYVYEAKVFGQQSNYVETAISLDWRGLLNARLSVAFDSYGSGHTAAAVELKGRYPVSDVLDLTSGLGVDQMAAVTSYDVAYWELGLRYFCGAHTVVDLRYVDNASTYELLGGAELARFTAAAVSARAVILISIGFLAVANSRPVVHVLDEPRGRMARYIGIEESSWPCRVARGTPF